MRYDLCESGFVCHRVCQKCVTYFYHRAIKLLSLCICNICFQYSRTRFTSSHLFLVQVFQLGIWLLNDEFLEPIRALNGRCFAKVASECFKESEKTGNRKSSNFHADWRLSTYRKPSSHVKLSDFFRGGGGSMDHSVGFV